MPEICIQGLFSRSDTDTTESLIHMFSRGFGGEGNLIDDIIFEFRIFLPDMRSEYDFSRNDVSCYKKAGIIYLPARQTLKRFWVR